MTIGQISTLPQPPVKTDPVNFAQRADNFLGSLPPFVSETNTAITGINNAVITCGVKVDECEDIRILANQHKTQAEEAANLSLSSANATYYSDVSTYNINDIVIGSNGSGYVCIANGVIGDNPVGSSTGNWLLFINSLSTVYQPKSANFTALLSHFYYVTPAAGTTVTATLPTDDKVGFIGFRLDSNEDSRKLLINPTGTHSIENMTNGDTVIIDSHCLSVWFQFDGTTWRVV